MAFKLGSEKRNIKDSSNVKISNNRSFNPNNVDIINTPLDRGTIAEANNDGTISVNSDARVSSAMMKKVIKHEMKHLKDINEGRADYGENWVMWEGKIYFRRNGMIDGPNGRWPEGHKNHPWEAEAIQAEKQ
tara:strand:- start:1396 stop:1791 length:396 start_codon:yes stop_codon:yes gene_type:complete